MCQQYSCDLVDGGVGLSSIFLTFNTKLRSIDDKFSLEKHAV